MTSVYLGTSGFGYPDWHGPFYPSDLPPDQRLSFYARQFNRVEVNYSYYRIPKKENIRSLYSRVPEGFLFSWKAHRSMTHERPETGSELEDRVRSFLQPLLSEASPTDSVPILLQFPYSFSYSKDNRRYLGDLAETIHRIESENLAEALLFVEFRNDRWQQNSVRTGMHDFDLHPVLLDLPRLDGLPEPFCIDDVAGTSSFYVRFHGRNKKLWWTGDNVSRYDYSYGEEELAERVEQLISVIVAFNNHYKGQAPAGAQIFARLLRETPNENVEIQIVDTSN